MILTDYVDMRALGERVLVLRRRGDCSQQEQNRLRALQELEELKQAHARCIHCPEPAATHDALGRGYCAKHLIEAVRRGAYHAQPQTPKDWLYENSAWLWIVGALLLMLFFAHL